MLTPLATRLALALSFGALAVACGGDDDSGGALGNGTGGKGGTGSGSGGTSTIAVTGGTSGTSGTGAGGTGNATATGGTGPYMLPAGYTKADDGGWKLGDPVVAGEPPPDTSLSGTMGCGQQLLGIVRDFRHGGADGHPDFNTFQGQGEKGAVMATLGDDDKPVFNPAVLNDPDKPCKADADGTMSSCYTSEANFNQWYNDDPKWNDPYYIFFSIAPKNGLATFSSKAFFPLDDAGFGNQSDKDHNFSFTTEVHTTFQYNGGENFSFTGDDDLWVFINKTLAIDLGGLHSSQSLSVDLDKDAKKLGITKGEIYQLDLFHAERHTAASNFNIQTNLYFVNCGVIVPSGPVK